MNERRIYAFSQKNVLTYIQKKINILLAYIGKRGEFVPTCW